MSQMIPWSYSFLRDLANCPYKAYRRYVTRDLPLEPDSPQKQSRELAMREGITTHKILENYINYNWRLETTRIAPPRLPVELEIHAKPLVAAGAKAEVKLGMTREFTKADFFDNPWGRGKADVLIVDPPNAILFDWKTGKVDEDDRELRCQAMLVRANYPDVTHVTGAYVWLKEKRMGIFYNLTDVNRTYHATCASMAEAESYGDDWPTKPNALCSYCPVLDCRFNSVQR